MHPSSLFGDDIFISYSRADGSLYAAGLADELTKRKFACFLDQLGTDPDRDLPATLKRKIGSCTVCVLVGTERALISESVKKEIEEFKKTKRTIIPIYFEGAPEQSSLYPLIPGLARSSETKEALTSGNPSLVVVRRVEKSFNYTRRNQRMRRILFGTATVFLVFAVASVLAGIKASNEVVKAAEQTRIAEEARRTADNEKKKAGEAEAKRILAEAEAKTARQEADDQKEIAKGAEIKRRDAEGKAAKAGEQQQLAERKTKDAEEKRHLAELETEKQQRIAEDRQREASSRELASNAISQLRIDPELSLMLATEAVKKWRTAEAENALRQSLLESRVHAVGQGHLAEVSGAEFSPDGEFVVMTSAENTATVLRLSTGERVTRLQGHTGPINSATFSAGGQFILTASDDNTARIWEWRTSRPPKILSGHTGPVISARFNSGGDLIVTTSADKTARTWSVTTGQTVGPIREGLRHVNTHGSSEQGEAISPNGDFLIAAKSNDDPWKLEDWVWKVGGEPILQLPYSANIESAEFSHDGKLMVAVSRTRFSGGGFRDEEVRVWDLIKGHPFAYLNFVQGHINGIALSPDGKLIVTASNNHVAQIWEIPEPLEKESEENSQEKNKEKSIAQAVEKSRVLSGHTGPVRSVAFSANGKFILTASDDKTARVWEASTGKEVAVLRGHKSPVESAAFSRDGKFMVTVGADNTTRVWDASMGQSLVDVRHGNDVTSARFSLDERAVVTASDDATVRVWNTTTGAAAPIVLSGHSAAISSDARLAATASRDLSARIYDPTTGQILAQLRGSGALSKVEFSPDGRLIMTTGHEVRLWNPATGDLIKELPNQTSAAFSPDGKTLITLSVGLVRRWDTSNWQSQGEPLKPDGAQNITFSGDGRLILTFGGGRAQVWETNSGCNLVTLPNGPRTFDDHKEIKLATINYDGRFVLAGNEYGDWLWDLSTTSCAQNKGAVQARKLGRGAVFSPDGKSIVKATGQQVDVLDVTTLQSVGPKLSAGNRNATLTAVYSPDGKRIITTGDDRTARVWDVSTGKIVTELTGLPRFVTSAKFSADGKFILTGIRDLSERENSLWLWETNTGKLVGKLHGYGGHLSGDGKLVAAISYSDIENIWDVASGQSLATLSGHTGRVVDSEFSADGSAIATVTDDAAVWVWDVASGKKLAELRGHTGKITSVAFSLDNKLVLTTAWYPDGSARVWDVSTGQSLQLASESNALITFAEISPDSGSVITASDKGIVKVWTLSGAKGEGVLGKNWELPGLSATSLSFSHDGKLVIGESKDVTTRVWEVSSGKIVTDLLGHEGGVAGPTFDSDDKFILTRGGDNTARVWEASTGREIAVLRGHDRALLSATFSKSGKFIVITNAYPESTASVYACLVCGRVEDLLAIANNRLSLTGREFTPQEQRTYLHKLLEQ